MGNGARAQQKRERNATQGKSVAKSQTKSRGLHPANTQVAQNEKAMNIQCQICKQTFLQTTKAPALLEHASNKHKKGLAECFPGVSA
ncbi:hypothetical protein N7532_002631 [Penicillium argentinense]|uniref:At2g23090-like zinc-binding domain-containing protein n=1 Tax=Penicillium argentinense TaxID=1131581 RepID=A0A9W9G0X3_9EURO|nr:uncharacterized protein N7532_002631 [Penicillium argentinense]KAJ5109986.1 hypothetical protein N7532_002631 [Penicillium argentinense]